MEIGTWKPFKDALRKPERNLFENMLLRSKLYASAAGMAVRPVVLEAMLMSILLDHHMRILELATEIQRLKSPTKMNDPEGVQRWIKEQLSLEAPHVDTSEQTTLSESCSEDTGNHLDTQLSLNQHLSESPTCPALTNTHGNNVAPT